MCGIVGATRSQESVDSWVKEALVELRRRGPDSTGIAKSKGVIFGSARLAMVDPQNRSNQPFLRNQSLLVFNGEIYNFQTIKSNLKGRHEFITESDTELLSCVLQEEGIEGLSQLNGMYSFAFYEESSQRFLLARDRLGKKPLYFVVSSDGEALSFCSLQAPLNEIGTAKLNYSAVICYLHLGFVIDPLTMYSQIKSVRPQESLSITRNIKKLSISSKTIRTLRNANKRNLRELVTESVMSRVHGENKVSISLSGGVDSTIIALVLAEQGVDATAFSVRWPDSDKERYNFDSEVARNTANSLGLDFVSVRGPDSREIPEYLQEYLEIMEEPNNNPTGLSMISLFKEIASNGFRLTLTGDGSDEIFAGYDRYKLIDKYRKFVDRIELPRSEETFRPSTIDKFLRMTVRTWSDWASWHQVFSRNELIDELKLEKSNVDEAFELFKQEFRELSTYRESSALKRMMSFDQKIWLSMESNRRLDRVSMFFSVEARSPFQDDSLNAYWHEKSNREISQGISKADLLKAFPEIEKFKLLSKKTGFSSPLGHWLRANATWVTHHVQWLSNNVGIGAGLRSDQTIGSNLHSGDFLKLQKIWTLVVLSIWLQKLTNSGNFLYE